MTMSKKELQSRLLIQTPLSIQVGIKYADI